MKRATLTIIATLVLALSLALTSSVALAGVSWEDSVPGSGSGSVSPVTPGKNVGHQLLPPTKPSGRSSHGGR
jgi:hypothetical protein